MTFRETKKNFDIYLFLSVIPIMVSSLSVLHSIRGEADFFGRQLMWVFLGLSIAFLVSLIDTRFLKRSGVVLTVYGIAMFLLVGVLIFGSTVKGSKSWFDFGFLSFQPSDLAKLALILILSKYFSRRHIEIKRLKHIFISLIYMAVPFGLIFLQPDFGSAMVLFFIWAGMALVAGISRKHLSILGGICLAAFIVMWFFVFQPYQKERLSTFINPLSDLQGAGYNTYQSIIAVGSGQFLGKGFGFGTQSRLEFLPEYETDFVFAAFSEEWGFVGVMVLLFFFFLLLWRIINTAEKGETNFEILFCSGVAILFFSHILVNIGMNLGVMPVTGIPLPFMSYGGSHILVESILLGIVLAMGRYKRPSHRSEISQEIEGIV
ncbi:MAG: rod shape-determining protein RodA [Candidatus Nomurabacteria bacterium]|nr:MAG: rod shape-determining protein RodA [Candidatus Nomurabacteria bacterium]